MCSCKVNIIRLELLSVVFLMLGGDVLYYCATVLL